MAVQFDDLMIMYKEVILRIPAQSSELAPLDPEHLAQYKRLEIEVAEIRAKGMIVQMPKHD
jgi:hypothetical protein